MVMAIILATEMIAVASLSTTRLLHVFQNSLKIHSNEHLLLKVSCMIYVDIVWI